MKEPMKRDQRVVEEAEKTLSAFDGMSNLKPNPFLSTQLEARIAEAGSGWRRVFPSAVWLKPAALGLFVILNIITIIRILDSHDSANAREQLVSALRQEYDEPSEGY
jgi:hypothetical protein